MRRVVLVTLVLFGCGSGGDGGGDGDGSANGDAGDIDAVVWHDGPPGGRPGSLRFYNSHVAGADRVEVRLDPHVPADIGAGRFTIELWFSVAPPPGGPGTDPLAAACQTGRDGWKSGNIVLDRDRSSDGLHGEFGLALFMDGIAFGLSQGTTGVGLCGRLPQGTTIARGWHHVAVTRDGTTLTMYLDGTNIGSATGPAGDVSYADGTTGGAKDPYLVIGADKDDTAGSNGLDGFIDELRISTSVRWTANFDRPTAPYEADAETAALYHFDDGGGTVLSDAKGTSPGDVKFGEDMFGSQVPYWGTNEPFLR